MATDVFPMQSVLFPDDESTKAARDLIFLQELQRQAEIATTNFEHGWRRGMGTKDPHDALTWSLLQAGLFAAIVVKRLLWPGRVREYPGLSESDSQSIARERGKRLRSILEIEDDSPLLRVAAVRDSFEHIDERLDVATMPVVQCISDWYITVGGLTATSDDGRAVALRAFNPAAGVLLFGDKILDLYALDLALLRLRQKVIEKTLEHAPKGRGTFGGHRLVAFDPEEVRRAATEWVAERKRLGHG